MRYRAIDADGDYAFGADRPFLKDSPAAVAQAVLTRLHLWAGEWFLDADEGTPYAQRVLGHGSKQSKDLALRARILGTAGVRSIDAYSSSIDAARRMVVSATVTTAYGQAKIDFVTG